MKCWCFNREQLERALRAYARRLGATGEPCRDFQIVYDFLDSPEAREHKIILDGTGDQKDSPEALRK